VALVRAHIGEFVAWYNGDPMMRDRQFALSSSREAVVIGQGNVALDVARVSTDLEQLCLSCCGCWVQADRSFQTPGTVARA
jgi:hypothetical protein